MIDHFFEHYRDYEPVLAQLQLVFFMLGMGATLTAADVLTIARQPRSLLAGAAAQFVMTPLVAVALNAVTGVVPGIAVGIVLVSLMPGGTLSKAFTLVGCGNLALSISLTICGTLAALFTVPLLLQLLAAGYIPDFEMPTLEIVRDICLFMLLPLLAGMTVGRMAPRRRFVFARWSVRFGFVVVVLVVVGSLRSGQIDPTAHGWRGPLAVILFCLLSQQLSMLAFRLLRWPRQDTLSIGMEATMRNINLAVLLRTTIFAGATGSLREVGDGVLWVVLYYGGTAFFFGLPLALRFRLMARRAARRALAGQQA
jgi:BASS family bile acid:Na+ symporter